MRHDEMTTRDTTTREFLVGCYTDAAPTGIHRFRADGDGSWRRVDGVEVEQASFLAVGRSTGNAADGRTIVYAVRETVPDGALLALRVGADTIEVIDEVDSRGAAPCHVTVGADVVHVANYVSGSVATYEVLADGRFGGLVGEHRHAGSGPHPRQAGPHAHCVEPSPDGRFVHAVDLGTDTIVRYGHDAELGWHEVGATRLAPGSGPRHVAFHPTAPLAFVVCELDNTLTTCAVDGDTGALVPRSVASTLPAADGATASIAAAVVVDPTGDRVHVSNRGHDSIATFAVDADRGRTELVDVVASGGRTPRHLALDPRGRLLYAADQDDDMVVAFELDGDGLPRPLGPVAEVSRPVCVVALPADADADDPTSESAR